MPTAFLSVAFKAIIVEDFVRPEIVGSESIDGGNAKLLVDIEILLGEIVGYIWRQLSKQSTPLVVANC